MTVPARIFVEGARRLNVEYHAGQVVDGVGVLLPAQAVVFHQSAPRHAGRGAFADLSYDHFDCPANLLGPWPGLILRRHFAGVESEHDFVPFLRYLWICEIGREIVETKLPLLFGTVMALKVMRLQEFVGLAEKMRAWFDRDHGRIILLERSRSSAFLMHSS